MTRRHYETEKHRATKKKSINDGYSLIKLSVNLVTPRKEKNNNMPPDNEDIVKVEEKIRNCIFFMHRFFHSLGFLRNECG